MSIALIICLVISVTINCILYYAKKEINKELKDGTVNNSWFCRITKKIIGGF